MLGVHDRLTPVPHFVGPEVSPCIFVCVACVCVYVCVCCHCKTVHVGVVSPDVWEGVINLNLRGIYRDGWPGERYYASLSPGMEGVVFSSAWHVLIQSAGSRHQQHGKGLVWPTCASQSVVVVHAGGPITGFDSPLVIRIAVSCLQTLLRPGRTTDLDRQYFRRPEPGAPGLPASDRPARHAARTPTHVFQQWLRLPTGEERHDGGAGSGLQQVSNALPRVVR